MINKILLRFDDICPTMNWEQWDNAMAILDKAGAKALFGVIPDCQDPDLMIDYPRADFWEYIKDLQEKGHTIAMHGLHHVFDSSIRGLVNKSAKSEFAGHPYEVQYEKIRRGKEILLSKGIETDVFFAPAHSYDENTLKALAANGFKYMSDGKSSKPYMCHGVVCVPARSGGIPRFTPFETFYTVILHAHEWAWQEKSKNYVRFKQLLDKKNVKVLRFEDFLKQWEIGNTTIQRLNEFLFVRWERYIRPFIYKTLKKLYRLGRNEKYEDIDIGK